MDEHFEEGTLLLEPRERFDACLIGRCASTGKAVYSADKILATLMEDMSDIDEDQEVSEGDLHERALEYFDYNILSSYVGEMTPIYIWSVEDRDFDDRD